MRVEQSPVKMYSTSKPFHITTIYNQCAVSKLEILFFNTASTSSSVLPSISLLNKCWGSIFLTKRKREKRPAVNLYLLKTLALNQGILPCLPFKYISYIYIYTRRSLGAEPTSFEGLSVSNTSLKAIFSALLVIEHGDENQTILIILFLGSALVIGNIHGNRNVSFPQYWSHASLTNTE